LKLLPIFLATPVYILGEKFIKYIDSLKPILFVGLRNFDEYQVCQAAVGVVGDLGRNLGVQLLPHCDDLMTILLEGLIVSLKLHYITF
jgi:importin subunit beta-1